MSSRIPENYTDVNVPQCDAVEIYAGKGEADGKGVRCLEGNCRDAIVDNMKMGKYNVKKNSFLADIQNPDKTTQTADEKSAAQAKRHHAEYEHI